jgi:hypothetical protein
MLDIGNRLWHLRSSPYEDSRVTADSIPCLPLSTVRTYPDYPGGYPYQDKS